MTREDLQWAIETAQQAVRYSDKHGSVTLSEVDLDILQAGIQSHLERKFKERPDGA